MDAWFWIIAFMSALLGYVCGLRDGAHRMRRKLQAAMHRLPDGRSSE